MLNKRVSKLSKFSLGAENEKNPGSFWHSINVDLERKFPYIVPSFRMEQEGSGAHVESLVCSVQYFNTVYASSAATKKIIRKETNGWTLMRTNTEAYGGLGMLSDSNYDGANETGNLYYMANQKIGKHDGTNWNDTWQTLKVSNAGNPMPSAKFLKLLCFGNMEYLAVYDLGSTSFNNERLAMPTGYKMTWMKATSDFLVMGLYHESLGGIIVLWDGISTTYNYVIRLGSVKSLGGDVKDNELFIVLDDGWIVKMSSTYTYLIQLARMPDSNEGVTLTITHDAIKFYQGILHIGIPGNASALDKRCYYGGIWAFNPLTNSIHFKCSVSNGGVIGSAGSGVSSIGTLMINPSGVKYLRAGWGDGNNYFIDINSHSGSYTPYPYGSTVMTKLFDAGEPYRRKRFMQYILNFIEAIPNSSAAKYIVRYCTSESDIKVLVTAVSGGTDYFRLSAGNSANVAVGDKVFIAGGTGAGQIRNITKKEVDGSNYKFTVDSILSASLSFSSTSVLAISEFYLLSSGAIAGNLYPLILNKMLRFNARSKKIQFEIEMQSPTGTTDQFKIGISDLSVIYVPDRIIK